MGQITRRFRFLLVLPMLFVLTACPERDNCFVAHLATQDLIVQPLSNVDTMDIGELRWFHGSFILPNLQGRKTIEKSLPYAPSLQLEFYQIAFFLPIDSLIRPVPYRVNTFTTIRPFVLHSQNGRSTYTGHMQAAFEAELTTDSVVLSFGLEAKKSGLYQISLFRDGLSNVLLDHRTEKCPVSWRYQFKFPGNQNTTSFSTTYDHLRDLDKSKNYLIYVR